MKIDLSNYASLIRNKLELESLLSTVNFAIANLPNGAASNGELKPQYQRVFDLVNSLPDRFTTSQVFEAMGHMATESRGTVRCALNQLEELKVILVVEKGRGRKPSTYHKISKSLPQPSV